MTTRKVIHDRDDDDDQTCLRIAPAASESLLARKRRVEQFWPDEKGMLCGLIDGRRNNWCRTPYQRHVSLPFEFRANRVPPRFAWPETRVSRSLNDG